MPDRPRVTSVDYQVAAARVTFGAVAAGAGRLLLVEGAPGTGRTTTVNRLAALASRAGLRTITATALPFDAEIPFGVARTLGARVDQEVASDGALAPGRLAELATGLLQSALHGDDDGRGACLLIDDAHWADAPSLWVLVHAARQLPHLPVALVLSLSLDLVDDAATPAVAELRAVPQTVTIRVGALDPTEADEVIESRIGATATPTLKAQLLQRTGGNPFLLTELVDHVAAVSPAAAHEPDDDPDLDGVVPPRVADAIAVRLARLDLDALAVARVVHVLGDEATITRAATLAGLDRRATEDAADALVRAGLLRADGTLSFVQPLLGDAVGSGIDPFVLDRMHRDAAHLLVDDRIPTDRVARHLLGSSPTGDPWVVDQLRAAAGDRLDVGDCATAATLLRRALEEPPPEDQRIPIVRDLAVAESRAGLPEAAARIEAALAMVGSVDDRILLLRERTRLMWLTGHLPEAVQASELAVAESTPGTDLHEQLLADLLAVASMHDLAPIYARPKLVDLLERAGTGWVPDSAALAATLATVLPFVLGDHRLVGPLVDRAVVEDLWRVDAPPFGLRPDFVIGSLWLTDGLERGTAFVHQGMTAVEPENLFRHGLLHYWLGEIRYAAGDLPGAIGAATRALSPEWGPFLSWFGFSSATLAHAHLDQGDHRRAEEVLASTEGHLDPDQLYGIAIDLARARLMLRHDRADEAVRLTELVSDRLGALGHRDSPQIVWRNVACTAAARIGEDDRARKLIDEEIDLARGTHALGRLGRALRTAATVCDAPARLPLLEDAVEVLATSERRLEHALALLALGREHYLLGDIASARAALADARELAMRCGAGVAANDALLSLHATGARPRRAAQSGVDSLTGAERRTVELAATGKTNREIGQLLAIAPRTVEWHLSRAFTKLGVTSRRELGAALDERP